MGFSKGLLTKPNFYVFFETDFLIKQDRKLKFGLWLLSDLLKPNFKVFFIANHFTMQDEKIKFGV